MGEMRNVYRVLVWSIHGRHNLEDLCVDGGQPLKRILNCVRICMDGSIWDNVSTVNFGFHKIRAFLDYPSANSLLKKVHATRSLWPFLFIYLFIYLVIAYLRPQLVAVGRLASNQLESILMEEVVSWSETISRNLLEVTEESHKHSAYSVLETRFDLGSSLIRDRGIATLTNLFCFIFLHLLSLLACVTVRNGRRRNF
jgi:hypothetical protein